MMRDEEIDRLIEAVSSRAEIDWDECEKTSGSAEDRALVQSLRHLRAIAGHGAPLSRVDLRGAARPAGADDAAALPESSRTGPKSSGDLATRGLGEALEAPEGDRPRWGHLTLLEKIGEGSYGEVFRAWDPKLQIDVALKLVPASFASSEEALREARLLARVHHTNVARVYGAERIGETVGVWMEYVNGGTLREVIREEAPIPEGRLLEIARALSHGLGAIHEANIVHRDLKPENVLLTTAGRLVITDFGCGALRTAAGAARRESFAGSPRYLAPELFAGGVPTPGTDCYSLAVVLFQLATGKDPIPASSVAELRAAHAQGERLQLQTERPDVRPALARAVDQALDPDPARRPRNLRAFVEIWDGAGAETGNTGAAANAGTTGRAATEAAGAAQLTAQPQATASTQPTSPVAAAKLSRRVLWGGGAVAVAVLAAVAAGIWSRSHAPLTFASRLLYSPNGTAWASVTGSEVEEWPLEVHVGDQLMIEFEAPRSCSVYILNWDETGNSYLLFPMKEAELKNPLAKNVKHTLPGSVSGEPFSWEVTSEGGKETFAVVASQDRLVDFERAVAGVAQVDVQGGNTNESEGNRVPAEAISGILRGVGRAQRVEANAADPRRAIEELRSAISNDSKLAQRIRVELFEVKSLGPRTGAVVDSIWEKEQMMRLRMRAPNFLGGP